MVDGRGRRRYATDVKLGVFLWHYFPPQRDRQLTSILQNVFLESNQGSPDIIGNKSHRRDWEVCLAAALALVPTTAVTDQNTLLLA